MKVAKFGGTSLATAQQIKKVCDIITSDDGRRLVVVSAPGKRTREDAKVTDMLIGLAKNILAGGSGKAELDSLVSRFAEIDEGLGLGGSAAKAVEEDLKKRIANRSGNKDKFMDAMKAAGEDNTARITAAYLKKCGHDARYIDPRDAGLLLSDEFGNARVLPESYANLETCLKNSPGISIFPGFFGYSTSGDIVTFPRGGSDITGSILAAAIKADIYENFTDVDSVFAANPNIVKNPAPISELTYGEMRELSYAGFSVLHEETLEPVYRMGIPVNIRNTNNPSAPGTMIVTGRERSDRPVVGIAGDTGFCSIYMSKYMMNREIGFGRKLLQILEDEELSYEHIPSGIDNLSVILRERIFTGDVEERVIPRIRKELMVEDIVIERDLGICMVVGVGMKRTVGLAVRATGALARAGINIEVINQGSSEVSLMFGVKACDVESSVQALYNEFFGK